MFLNQTMFVVANNEDNTEDSYEFIDQARSKLCRLVEAGINAQMFRANTVHSRHK